MSFRFKDSEKAAWIRNFIDTLCEELPEVAQELLNVPIKNVEHWLMATDHLPLGCLPTSSKEIGELPCGCLIGGTVIAAARVYPDAVDVIRSVETAYYVSSVVSLATDILKTLDDEFDNIDVSITSRIGHAVSEEVHGLMVFHNNREREREFETYVKNRIRKNLSIS